MMMRCREADPRGVRLSPSFDPGCRDAPLRSSVLDEGLAIALSCGISQYSVEEDGVRFLAEGIGWQGIRSSRVCWSPPHRLRDLAVTKNYQVPDNICYVHP